MSTPADSEQSDFPASNVNSVVTDLWTKTIDLDGGGLVEMFRILAARAEQIQAIRRRVGEFDRGLLADAPLPDQTEFNAAFLESGYETTCLKWFLACACKRLAQDLEYDVCQKQQRLRRIESVVYNKEGEVESFSLDKS